MDIGYWILEFVAIGYWILDIEYWILDSVQDLVAGKGDLVGCDISRFTSNGEKDVFQFR